LLRCSGAVSGGETCGGRVNVPPGKLLGPAPPLFAFGRRSVNTHSITQSHSSRLEFTSPLFWPYGKYFILLLFLSSILLYSLPYSAARAESPPAPSRSRIDLHQSLFAISFPFSFPHVSAFHLHYIFFAIQLMYAYIALTNLQSHRSMSAITFNFTYDPAQPPNDGSPAI